MVNFTGHQTRFSFLYNTPFNMRLLLFSLFCTATLFTSCDKEENEEFDSNIVGTWSLLSGSGTGQTTTTAGGDTYTVDFNSQIVDPTVYEVDLNTDGTVTSQGSVTFEINSDFDGQNFKTTMTLSNIIGNGTYEVIGNRLIATDNDGKETQITIVSLTDTELILEAEIVQTQAANGAESESRQKATQVYERVD